MLAVAGGRLLDVDAERTLDHEPPPPSDLSHVTAWPAGADGAGGAGDTLLASTTDGGVLALRSGEWERLGRTGAPVTAFAAAGDGRVLAATHNDVLVSDDGGRGWRVLVPLSVTATDRANR